MRESKRRLYTKAKEKRKRKNKRSNWKLKPEPMYRERGGVFEAETQDLTCMSMGSTTDPYAQLIYFSHCIFPEPRALHKIRSFGKYFIELVHIPLEKS